MLRGSLPNTSAPWFQHLAPVQALAVAVSLLMTAVAVMQDPMLNSDGVLYLLAAESIAAGDLKLALSLHQLPLYPMLIAGMHAVTGASFELSAYVVNALLQALLVFAFIAAATEIEGSGRNAWLAAAVILSFAGFNDYRSEIIRGFGYWALVMLGFWLLVHHARRRQIGLLAAALLMFGVAAMFRVEGLVLVLLVPLGLFLLYDGSLANRAKTVVAVYAGYLALVVVLVAIATASGRVSPSALLELPLAHASNILHALTDHMAAKQAAVEQHLLGRFSYEYAGAVVWATILIILAGGLLSSLGWVYGLAVLFAVRAGLSQLASPGRSALFAMLLINVLVLGAFVVASGFLTGRYTLAFALFALLLAPAGLQAVYDLARARFPTGRQVPVLVFLMGFVACYMLIDGVVSTSPGKVHEQAAAVWLRDNVEPSERILSFDSTILYRARRLEPAAYVGMIKRQRKVTRGGQTTMKTWRLSLEENAWQQHDYLVAAISRKRLHEQAEIEQIVGRQPLKVFESSRKDRVVIYGLRDAEQGRAAVHGN